MPTHIQILGSIVIILALGLVVFGDRLFTFTMTDRTTNLTEQEVDITPEIRAEAEIENQLHTQETSNQKIDAIIEGEIGLEPIVDDATFGVHINENLIHTSTISSLEEAEEQCEGYAYAAENIWELVTCTYNNEIIYQDVFIPG